MRVHGLEPRQGDTVFAFFVLRFIRAVPREDMARVIAYVAPICPGADTAVDELAAHGEMFRIVALPWRPPEAGSDLEVQRRLIEAASAIDVGEAWFFQAGTELPDLHPDDDELDEGTSETRIDTPAIDEGTEPVQIYPAAVAQPSVQLAEDDTPSWTHGAPPMVASVRFPVDGYPKILDEHDWEDFGLALKLSGAPLMGEETVLLAFHALWLTPYGGRYRNAGATIDRERHAAHLWVDRFAVPADAELQVHHLLWIASKLDEVLPVVHARFAGATMAQKYADMLDEATEQAFVLGGNPLLAVYARSGDEGIDSWLARQTVWSDVEVAQMLRELAIDVVTGGDTPDGDVHGAGVARDITRFAGEILAERARAGLLDPRSNERLRPLLACHDRLEHRRTAAIRVLHAAGDTESAPALVDIVRDNSIATMLDAIARTDLVIAAAEALGTFAHPAAAPALDGLLATPSRHGDRPRPVAARALARCLARAPEPRVISEPAITAIMATLEQATDPLARAELYLAAGTLAHVLPADQRSELCARLACVTSSDPRQELPVVAALALAQGGDAELAAVREALHRALTARPGETGGTAAGWQLALRVAAELPQLVVPTDLAWLTTAPDADVRERAVALAARLRDDPDAN